MDIVSLGNCFGQSWVASGNWWGGRSNLNNGPLSHATLLHVKLYRWEKWQIWTLWPRHTRYPEGRKMTSHGNTFFVCLIYLGLIFYKVGGGRTWAENKWKHRCCAPSLDKQQLRWSSLLLTRGSTWRAPLSSPANRQTTVQIQLLHPRVWLRLWQAQRQVCHSWRR